MNSAVGYHVTETQYLPAILRDGLVPQLGERSVDLGEVEPRVFFFSDIHECENGLTNWLGEWYCDREEETGVPVQLAILEIDFSEIAVYRDGDITFEVFSEQVVAPSSIRRIFDEMAFTALCNGKAT